MEQVGLRLLDTYASKEQGLSQLEEIGLRLLKVHFQKEQEIFSLNEVIKHKLNKEFIHVYFIYFINFRAK